MKKQVAELVICGLAAVSICSAQAPTAGFIGDGPGVNAPFTDSVDPDTYGLIHSGDVSGWEFDGTSGIATGWQYIRYRPTLASDPDNHVAMPDDEDWVFEISLMQETAFGPEDPWYIKNEDQDLRIMALGSNVNGTYNIKASNPDNSYTTVAEVSLPLGQWGHFVAHYKAATETLDAYVNGELVAADFTVQLATVDWVQAEWQRMGTTYFRDIKLGQFGTAPECSPGDADGDSDVDDDDLSLLLANWGSEVATCAQGEFSEVPPVDDDDLSLLLANWTGPLGAAVPEPATMLLIGLAAPAMLRLRRKA